MTKAQDEIRFQVIWSNLIAIVEEQARTLMRTAFSPVVRDSGDLSAALFDRAGNMLAHWEGDTFCGASLVHDDDALLADVRDLAMSVKRALESMPGKLKGALPGVSVGVTLPGSAGTVSEALGKAFGALEDQAQKGGNGIKVAGASQRNH